jgi:hypothetical protein
MHSLPRILPSFGGQSFPIGWAKRWKLFNRLSAQCESNLGTEAYQAAQLRGEQLPSDELEQEIAAFLNEIA